MTTMNSNEREERLKQIRERLDLHRQEAEKYRNRVWADQRGLDYNEAPNDVDFLLSLLDSQASTKPVGWISCGMRRDRIVDIVFENNDCAEAFLNGVEPAVGPIVAATRMRDACVAKVREMRDEWREKHASASNLETWRHFGTLFNGADEIITALESLTLDQVGEKEAK